MHLVVVCMPVIVAPPIVVGEWKWHFCYNIIRRHAEYYLLWYVHTNLNRTCIDLLKSIGKMDIIPKMIVR